MFDSNTPKAIMKDGHLLFNKAAVELMGIKKGDSRVLSMNVGATDRIYFSTFNTKAKDSFPKKVIEVGGYLAVKFDPAPQLEVHSKIGMAMDVMLAHDDRYFLIA